MPSETGRETSRRLPPTSTTIVSRSVSSSASASVGAGEGLDVVDELGLDPAGVDRERVGGAGEFGGERRVGDDRAVERDGGGHALDLELVQRAAARSSACSRVAPVTISLASSESTPGRSEPDSTPASRRTPGPDGGRERGDGAGRGQEAAARVLAVDAELEGVAAQFGVAVAEFLAVGDAEHLADQVDAGDLLGDRVLDLEAGVDLEEGDRAVLADEELDGAGADVAGLLAGSPWRRRTARRPGRR
jgi:hypothetical protein